MAISCDQDAFLEARLTAVESQILTYQTAIATVSAGQSYRLDTGQTEVSVTRANLTELRKALDALWNERALLRQHLGCTGNVILSPGF